MRIEVAYQTLYTIVIIFLLLLIGAMMIRSVKVRRFSDRIMSINMIGTMIICIIAVLSNKLEENYLCDVALIYAMISFLAVLMLTSLNTPAHPDHKKFMERTKRRHASSKKGGTDKS